MKLAHVFLVCSILLASGCIKLDETLTLNKDGSGTLDVAYELSEQSVSQVKAILALRKQMAAITGGGATLDLDQNEYTSLFLNPAEDRLRKEIKKYQKYRVTIEKLNVETQNAWRKVQMKLQFQSIAEVAKSDFFKDYGFSLLKHTDGNYMLYRDSEEGAGNNNANVMDADTLKLLTPVLSDFDVTLRVTTPGRILKTNAHKASLYSASWNFAFDKNPNAVAALQKQQLRVVFDGKDINLPKISVR